jgi:hypothetical protein
MNHNPELAQTLPVRELHELVTSDKYSSIVVELDNLGDSDDGASKQARPDLLLRLRNLKLAALKKYRKEQRDNPFRTAKTEDVGHYRTPFSRIRHVMFTVASIVARLGGLFWGI